MKVEILGPAELGLLDAIAHYNDESEGLGFEFAAEVKRTLARIIEYPNAWAPLTKRTCRSRTNRFPYGVIYQVREGLILIVAVMHLSKHPESWRSRLGWGER